VGAPLCCVVNADAYGHGAAVAGPWLEENGAAAFAVSCLAEARHLRRHGISKPILILGYTDPLQVDQLAFNCITQTVYSEEYAKALSAAAQNAGVEVHCHFKVDTGMGRIGYQLRSDFKAAIAAMERCAALTKLHFSGIFHHFAVADKYTPENEAYHQAQHALVERTVQRLKADGVALHTIHCANSGGTTAPPGIGPQADRRQPYPVWLDPPPEMLLTGCAQHEHNVSGMYGPYR
jgi:Alanine racemase